MKVPARRAARAVVSTSRDDYHYAVAGDGWERWDKPVVVRVAVVSRGAIEARIDGGRAVGFRRRMPIASLVGSSDEAIARWRASLEARVTQLREEAQHFQTLLDGPAPTLVLDRKR